MVPLNFFRVYYNHLGIPTLVLLDADLEVINQNARSFIEHDEKFDVSITTGLEECAPKSGAPGARADLEERKPERAPFHCLSQIIQ